MGSRRLFGLGLAVADGIVREHAGTLIARNRQGVGGAVFEIVMPRRAPHTSGAGLEGDAEPRAAGGGTLPAGGSRDG